MHGKTSPILHARSNIFTDIPSPFHRDALSLARSPKPDHTFPDCLEVTAKTDDGVIMGLRHRNLPIFGVQFHPESIETRHGHRLLQNFLRDPATGGTGMSMMVSDSASLDMKDVIALTAAGHALSQQIRPSMPSIS